MDKGMHSISVRSATMEDAEILFEWRNDLDARRGFRNGELITFNKHLSWLEASLNDHKRFIVIGCIAELEDDIGMVRFDEKSLELAEVAINLNPNYRGQRLAAPLLRAASNFFFKQTDMRFSLEAFVKETNTPSLGAFCSAGYDVDSTQDGYVRLVNNYGSL